MHAELHNGERPPRRWSRRRVIGATAVATVAGAAAPFVARLRSARLRVSVAPGSPPVDDRAAAALMPAPTAPGGPRRADEMAAMLGVVIHLTGDPGQAASDHRGDYLYSKFRDEGPTGGPGWLRLLAEAGFRHVRCDTGGSVAADGPSQRFALETMRLLDQTKPAWSPPYVTGIEKVYLSSAAVAADLPVLRRDAGKLWMIEGPNEAWPPNGKFLPSFVRDNDQVFMCLHAVACQNAIAPGLDPARWSRCRDRGRFMRATRYAPGDIVTFAGRSWAAPPDFRSSAASVPPDGWWDLTALSMPAPFSNRLPGIYFGYDQAGELGVAWGEFIARQLSIDDLAGLGHWSRAGRAGGPTRIATWSEAGMDIYAFWNPDNDASLLPRYMTSMPGGATNVHLYAAGQPSDVAAECGASVARAARVLPGYPIYLGEIGQATYPTDDRLALGTAGPGGIPSSTVSTATGTFPVDQDGRPMPGSSTGRFGAEEAQAQTVTRSWAEMFRSAPAGSRLAVYELLNEPFNGYGDYAGRWGYPPAPQPAMDYDRSEGNFGLLRSDFSPKPAMVAIANTCRLMGDPGDQRFQPQTLDITVTRTRFDQQSAQGEFGSTDDLRWTLAQSSDGTFRVLVWYSNVRATRERLPGLLLGAMTTPGPAEPVTLAVGGGARHRIEAYNTQVSGDRPLVVVDGATEITWPHTADLWIIKVAQTA